MAPAKADRVTATAPGKNRMPKAAPTLAPEDAPIMSGGSEGIAENGLIDKAGNSEDKAADCTDHSAACAQGEKNPPLYRVPG